jgi:hypothetical protein
VWDVWQSVQKENMADKWEHHNEQVGEKHPRAKLTNAAVCEIRAVYDEIRRSSNNGRVPKGTMGALCERFGLSLTHLEHIVYQGSWKGVA